MSDENVTSDDLTRVFEGILGDISSKNQAAFEQVTHLEPVHNAIESVKAGKPEDFYFDLIYPLSQMVDGLLHTHLESHEARFLFKHGQFVELHFQKLIEQFEGSICCADKSRAIMNRLVRYYMTGQEIEFSPAEEVTYHHPKVVFTTHQQIVDFAKALHHLYYGQPNHYLTALHEITTAVQASKNH